MYRRIPEAILSQLLVTNRRIPLASSRELRHQPASLQERCLRWRVPGKRHVPPLFFGFRCRGFGGTTADAAFASTSAARPRRRSCSCAMRLAVSLVFSPTSASKQRSLRSAISARSRRTARSSLSSHARHEAHCPAPRMRVVACRSFPGRAAIPAHARSRNRQRLLAAHRRQVLKYVDKCLDHNDVNVCAGIIYPKAPTSVGLQSTVEKYLNDHGLQVVWYADE